MTNLLQLMEERHSCRTPFDRKRPVAQQDLRQILEAGRWASTAYNMQNFEVIVIDDQHILEKIGNIQTQISATFLKENYQQLSFSEEELRQKKVGILGTLFPPSWRDPSQLDRVAAEGEPSFLRDTLQDCPTLLILLYDASKRAPASEGDVLGCMSLGCVLENMWLMAQSLGIGIQILSI